MFTVVIMEGERDNNNPAQNYIIDEVEACADSLEAAIAYVIANGYTPVKSATQAEFDTDKHDTVIQVYVDPR